MAYCRWSTDDFRCDIYAYESDGGCIIHVAANRVVGDVPRMPDPRTSTTEEYMAAYHIQRAFLATAKREPITLPHAGESFGPYDDLEDFEAQMLDLRKLGYLIPDYVFEQIAEERKAEAND